MSYYNLVIKYEDSATKDIQQNMQSIGELCKNKNERIEKRKIPSEKKMKGMREATDVIKER